MLELWRALVISIVWCKVLKYEIPHEEEVGVVEGAAAANCVGSGVVTNGAKVVAQGRMASLSPRVVNF